MFTDIPVHSKHPSQGEHALPLQLSVCHTEKQWFKYNGFKTTHINNDDDDDDEDEDDDDDDDDDDD